MTCKNCRFFRDKAGSAFKSGYGKCYRYPQPAQVVDDHWCGEFAEQARNEKEDGE